MKKETIKETISEEDKVLFLDRIKLRDKIIDEQRLRIKLLKIELNKKQWWKFWK